MKLKIVRVTRNKSETISAVQKTDIGMKKRLYTINKKAAFQAYSSQARMKDL